MATQQIERPKSAEGRRQESGVLDRGEALSAEEFKRAFREHPAGVALVTADAGAGPVALTATSVSSVSAEPPLLVFSISDQSSASTTINGADTVIVHLLSSAQLGLAKLGATSGIDRFADRASWSRLDTGEPYFPAARTWIRGRVLNRLRAGTSTVVIVQALHAELPEPAETAAEATPLVYVGRTWHALGEPSRIE
ncbi:MAG: flavin oxidoreductase [Microbacterium sp. 14-71-5]|uniref:flavin reductase family protein n=1 Tax=Microbacterium sp. 13-71-7 TaxID=1970399 RepID=UPI000BCCF492|nr:flavin reductase family protein [Microbacterium sp. 13-71-7]OZB83077.1 MAG: flavin oxidoreductase [Microbacterium sp. 13-71-7]OZB88323.1 MAG: flavin oxidoreductase [Microbacterium sp. 14-71-5]